MTGSEPGSRGGEILKTVILAGGLGTRLAEETVVRPKPMVEIGGKPILWHIMSIYAAQGFKEFVVALGYKGEMIKQYFLHFFALNSDLTVDLSSGQTTVHAKVDTDWTVHLVDTGLHTETGGRLKRLEPWIGRETFMMTYGDGVADVDLHRLLEFHRSHGKLATVTAVRPPARFGGLRLNGDRVVRFVEKPQTGEGWINGGFFVLEQGALDYIPGDVFFEREPLINLARDGQLGCFHHEGFWQCMDTPAERDYLNQLWEGDAPWALWRREEAR